jgi:preprotein translocase subunit SecG
MLEMFVALFLVAVLVVIVMLLTPTNSACTGNCRQGRDCNCTGKIQ